MRRIVLPMAFVLVLAACTSASDTTTTTAGLGGATSTTEGGVSSTTSTSTPATSSTAAPGSTGGTLAECMVGTWVLDAQPFFDLITESMADSADGGEFVYLGGVNQITASADGTFVDERIDWNFGVVTDAGELEMTVNHRQSGTWSVDGDTVSTVITDNGGAPDYTMAIDGVPFEIPGGTPPIQPPDTSFDSAAATCGPSTLSMTVDGFTSTWTRTG